MKNESQTQPAIAEGLRDMALAISLPCARCGYDLRSLRADGDCPECFEPIRLTIIETIDPAVRRLAPLPQPKRVGNVVTGVVILFFVSFLVAVLAMLTRAPDPLLVPQMLRALPTIPLVLVAMGLGVIALVSLLPMLAMCKHSELVGCKGGLSLTSIGLLLWSCSMLLVLFVLLGQYNPNRAITMLFDACLPVLTVALVFLGFKKLIPRLGFRSRAFRQAQGSRQRMNDLLGALLFVLVGRVLIVTSASDSNLAILGLIIMVMSIALILIGLGYLVRNTIWIRQALATPPPSLSDLLTRV